MNYRVSSLLVTFFLFIHILHAQEIVPEMSDTSIWGMTLPGKTSFEQDVITLDGSEEGKGGMVVLANESIENGTIEIDLKGSNTPGRSFVGVAFNLQSLESYEAIYFRPFNFQNPQKKSHSIQYINMPTNGWRMLRTHYPEQYESELNESFNGDEWFHVRLVLLNGIVKVYVNEEKEPSFKNLKYRKIDSLEYGYNEKAGGYFEAEDKTKLYFESYGEGDPILMLHGGVYGYIDEYKPFIDELSKTNRVICLGTRGHVKSDIGHQPLSFKQRASDAIKLLDHLNVAQASVIGFSDGGLSAYELAGNYPERVKKVVIIGAGHVPENSSVAQYSSEQLMKSDGEYFKKRISHMPQPERWSESVTMLNDLYNNHRISDKTYERIECPVLLLAGSQDGFASPERLFTAHKRISNSDLSIIPGCGHVVFFCNWEATWSILEPFILDAE